MIHNSVIFMLNFYNTFLTYARYGINIFSRAKENVEAQFKN